MCCKNVYYAACGHSHMSRVSCKHKRNSLFCFLAKSKPCYSIHDFLCEGWCGICREAEERNRREVQAYESRKRRDSYLDVVANIRVAELPTFALQAPPAAVHRHTLSQPRRSSRTPRRSDERAGRHHSSHSRPQDESLHQPARLLDPSSAASSRPRVSPNTPPSITMHSSDSDVSLVSVGPMNPRSVSPDEFGRKPSHYRPRR